MEGHGVDIGIVVEQPRGGLEIRIVRGFMNPTLPGMRAPSVQPRPGDS